MGTTMQQPEQQQPLPRTNWIYRFDFTNANSDTSDITVSFSSDGITFQPYNTPRFPLDSQPIEHVVARDQDILTIQLVGPAGWSLIGNIQVIVARSGFALRGQRYSPFSGRTFIPLQAEMAGSILSATVGVVNALLGRGATERYEIIIAFSADLPGVGVVNFSYDPEMDVVGI